MNMEYETDIKYKDANGFRFINLLVYLTLTFHFLGNFIGLPYVKFTYLLFVALVYLLIFTQKPSKVFWSFIVFSLIEGQGRVLWGYAAWSRIIFDISLVILIIRSAILDKQLWTWDKLPSFLNIMFILHFIWFGIELFNPQAAGFFPSFATSKFYIFPILLFFYYLRNPFDINDTAVQRKLVLIVITLIAVTYVTIVQDIGKEDFLGGISSNYLNLFKKYSIFQDYAFRPWGTSFVAGGMGTFYYNMVGFVFLLHPKKLARHLPGQMILNFLKVTCLGLMSYSCFIGEVRSATIKFFCIIALIGFFRFLASKFKFKSIIILLLIFLSAYSLKNSFNYEMILGDRDFDAEIGRWSKLADEGVGSQRSGFDSVLNLVTDRVKSPLGFGLGMTTSFLPAYEAQRKANIGTTRSDYWNLDNLLVSLVLELGVGAVFYASALMFITFSLISILYHCLKRNFINTYLKVSIAVSTVVLIIIGNWGAVAIPYNPESFFFWFWVAFAYNEYHKVDSLSPEKKNSLS